LLGPVAEWPLRTYYNDTERGGGWPEVTYRGEPAPHQRPAVCCVQTETPISCPDGVREITLSLLADRRPGKSGERK
jgi:hypothetical protein